VHSQRDYFNAIGFDGTSGLCLVVCSLLDGNLTPYHCASIEDAQRKVAVLKDSHDIFVSLGLVKKGAGRGKESDVESFLGLVVDVDCQHEKRKKSGHFETIEEATAAVDALLLKPSMVVSTGHGIQVYWLWKEPWDLVEPEERDLAKSISHGWNQYVAGELKRTVDPTFSLEHIYRVPGTTNRKYDEKPECQILILADRRYDPTEFEPFAAEAQKTTVTVRLTPLVERIPARLQTILQNSADFRSIWNHKDPDQGDTSQSGWDWKIASLLVDVGLSDQEIGEALLANRHLHSGKPKPTRYYERTLSRIRANRHVEQAQEQEEGWYTRLSRMVGARVIAIDLEDPRHSVEDCVYWVRFASGVRVHVRKDSQIRSRSYWLNSLRGMAPLDQLPVPPIEKRDWNELMEKLRLHCVLLEQASAARQIINEIATYLDQSCVEVDDYASIRKNDRRPLKHMGQYLFIQSDFLVWYAKLYGRIDKAALREALEELSATRRRLGPHAVEYTEITTKNLRAEASFGKGTTHHADGTGGAGGGTPEDPQGHGDLDRDSPEGDGIRGLPGFNHPN
jgi:hypothetical protein